MAQESLHFELSRGSSPFGATPLERPNPRPGVALCLSGGGYRAMLFHLGALWRLNEEGLLARMSCISSVSGGSIVNGVFAMNWSKFDFDSKRVITNFGEQVTKPIRRMASQSIDIKSVLGGIVGGVSKHVADQYEKYLFGPTTLQDLPDSDYGPRFVFSATNLQTGVLWSFSKAAMGDWRVGWIPNPVVRLADAVAASSAFPPFLSPFLLRCDPSKFGDGRWGDDLQANEYRKLVELTDGGVFDNLGLEIAWATYETVFVSDGGGRLKSKPKTAKGYLGHSVRILDVIDNQVRSLRKRQVIGSYVAGSRTGAYWGIWTDINNYGVSPLACPYEQTSKLASIDTRLKALNPRVQEQLINWGYAASDAALRAHYCPTEQTGSFPYPGGIMDELG